MGGGGGGGVILKVMKKRFQLFICVQVLFKHILILQCSLVLSSVLRQPAKNDDDPLFGVLVCLRQAQTPTDKCARNVFLYLSAFALFIPTTRRRRDTVDFNSLLLLLLLLPLGIDDGDGRTAGSCGWIPSTAEEMRRVKRIIKRKRLHWPHYIGQGARAQNQHPAHKGSNN